jgi:phage repressor protein C with HTH and peptisase S24 domain
MNTNNKSQIRADNLLALIRDRYEGNRSKFSRALIAGGVKMSPVQIGQWIDGVRNMSENSAAKIEAALSLPENYFSKSEMFDSVTMHSAEPTQSAKGHGNVSYIREITVYDNLDELPDESVLIPVIDAKLSAGHGRDNPHIDIKEPLPFTGAFIKHLGIQPKNAVMMKVDGDSMQPTLYGGNSVLIDKGSTTPSMNGEVFAVIIEDEWMVKRLYKRIGGGLIIESDNKHGKFFNADWNEEQCEAARVDILGRVRYQSGTNGGF